MQRNIMPVARAIFCIFFTHSLFARITNSLASRNMSNTTNYSLVATGFVVLLVAGSVIGKLADVPGYPGYLNVVWLGVFFVSVYPLQEIQDAVNQLKDDPMGLRNSSYSWHNILFMGAGGLLWVLSILGMLVTL